MVLTNTDFVKFLEGMLGMPYWYGTCVYKCTKSVLDSKSKQYPSHYTSSRMSKYKDAIAKNLVAADCVGLGKGYIWTNGGQGVLESIGNTNTFKRSYAINGCPDKSANGMFTYAKSKGLKWGKIDTIPEIPGLAVRFDGHVGYYVGNGEVIEEKGFKYGCVRTKLKSGKWDYWYEFPGITYSGSTSTNNTTSAATTTTAKVKSGIGVKLNLRASASTSANILLKIDNDSVVKVIEKDGDWTKIFYANKTGFVMTQYLAFDGTPANKVYVLGERLPMTKGMKGEDVKEMQEILEDLGYKLEKYGPDGDFGSETERKIKEYQRAQGMIATGTVTKELLDEMIKDQGDDDPADREEEEQKVTTYDFSKNPTLRKGDKNDDVVVLQTYLKQLGYNLGTYGEAKDGIDGEYGAKTQTAVRALQKKANIKVDGICGPNTWNAIAKALV